MKATVLLELIDAQIGGGPRAWSDVAMLRNVGPLVASEPFEGDVISNRGFNAVVFARGADASHFLKVRPERHEHFRREVEATVRLSHHRVLGGLVPRSSAFVAGPARVLAQDFVNGVSLDLLLKARHARPWHDLAADVLRAVAPMWKAIAEVAVDGSAALAEPALLADLSLLEGLGLSHTSVIELASRLRAARLPAQPQHGDFWPRNVLQAEGRWQVLDFENCGEVVLPLYDVFHMVRGCGIAASGNRENWIEAWAAAGAQGQPLADEVRRQAAGLDFVGIEAALVSYLVDFAARLHKRGVSRERTAGRLRELNGLPGLLKGGALRRVLG